MNATAALHAEARPDDDEEFAAHPIFGREVLARDIPASLVLHGAIALIAAAALTAQPDAIVPTERRISVDILSPDDFAALRPESAATPEAGGTPAGMIAATTILSGAALADPRNRQARETLPLLDSAERMVQLCVLEAMEQVHAWQAGYLPDAVSSYAFEETVVTGDAVIAEGAAFRSGDMWYRLRYDCRLAPDRETVARFAFAVGDPVPEEDWERFNLDAPLDEPLESHGGGEAPG